MKTGRLFLVSLVVVAAMAGFAWYTAGLLPADAKLPTHWGATGVPDRYSPAMRALMMPPIILLGVSTFLAVIPRIEPLQNRLDASAPLLRAAWLGLVVLMLLIQATIGLPAYGISPPVKTVFVGMGLMLLLVGNALPKSRPGFFVGIRTPWTLTDTDNWIATHRLGGKLMMLAGAAIVLAGILPLRAEATAIVLIAAVLIAAGIPAVYSWWYWQRKKKAGPAGGEA